MMMTMMMTIMMMMVMMKMKIRVIVMKMMMAATKLLSFLTMIDARDFISSAILQMMRLVAFPSMM